MGCGAYASMRGKKHFPSIGLSLEQMNIPSQQGLWLKSCSWLSPDMVLMVLPVLLRGVRT